VDALIRSEGESITEPFLEVTDISGERLVTVIEFISPSNKRLKSSRDSYLKSRAANLERRANLVEVDLVRAAGWQELMKPLPLPAKAFTTYRVSLRRSREPSAMNLWPIELPQRLPVIPIPAGEGNADIPLDLQELVDRAYLSGRYDSIDYRRECDPPLSGDDAIWADRLLREAGRR
jgi:hypothetical protein